MPTYEVKLPALELNHMSVKTEKPFGLHLPTLEAASFPHSKLKKRKRD